MQTLRGIIDNTEHKVVNSYILNTIDGIVDYIKLDNGYTCAYNHNTKEYHLFKGWSSTPTLTKKELINKLMEV